MPLILVNMSTAIQWLLTTALIGDLFAKYLSLERFLLNLGLRFGYA